MNNNKNYTLPRVFVGFLLIAMILLTERIGIVYKAQDTSKQILPREEVQNLKVIPKEHDTLIVYDPENAASTKAMTQYDSIMTDMRVGYDKVEISRVTNAVISKYKKLIIIFPNLNDWSTQIETVKEWTDKGGHLMLGYRPQYSGVLASLSDELGIKEFNDDYILCLEVKALIISLTDMSLQLTLFYQEKVMYMQKQRRDCLLSGSIRLKKV